MKAEMYIKKLIVDTGLSREEIQEMVELKKKKLRPLISEEVALRIITNELGVDLIADIPQLVDRNQRKITQFL